MAATVLLCSFLLFFGRWRCTCFASAVDFADEDLKVAAIGIGVCFRFVPRILIGVRWKSGSICTRERDQAAEFQK